MALGLAVQQGTGHQFARLFNRLAVALREPQDDTGAALRVYFEALRDLPLAALETATLALMREPGRRFMPTVGEWRAAALVAQEAALRVAVAPARDEPWHLECVDCEDTGWTPRTCPGLTAAGLAPCERTRPHAPHDYVRACACRATNQTFRRHQAFGGT